MYEQVKQRNSFKNTVHSYKMKKLDENRVIRLKTYFLHLGIANALPKI